MSASVLVRLGPDGTLVARLSAPSGTGHEVQLTPGNEIYQLRNILLAQTRAVSFADKALGTAASPTQAQLIHEAKHGDFPDPKCAFCKDLIRRAGIVREAQEPRVVVIPPRGKARPALATIRTHEFNPSEADLAALFTPEG